MTYQPSSAENGLPLPTPREAADLALHYLSHVTDGWHGYSLDDAAEYTANRMVDFLAGEMTYESDVRPRCDEWCVNSGEVDD